MAPPAFGAELDGPGASQAPRCCKHESSTRAASGPAALFGTNGAYYSNGAFLGDWFGPGRYSVVLAAMSDGETLYHRLHELGAKYFLVNYSEAITPMMPYDDPGFSRHFHCLSAVVLVPPTLPANKCMGAV